jgi:hypothetical protein
MAVNGRFTHGAQMRNSPPQCAVRQESYEKLTGILLNSAAQGVPS